jgi:hypothetical protein
MNLSAVKRWRRALLLVGAGLGLAGAFLYGLDRVHRQYFQLVYQADTYYQARQYREAIAAYQRVLERAAEPLTRISIRLLGHTLSPASTLLQIANCRYRLAEAELRHYQQAARDPRITPRPSLETVQRLLSVAGKAYAEVPQSDPWAYVAAQINGARVAAWQLILAAFDEQTTGRRALRQQAIQVIRQTATAVDLAYRYPEHISRQERMTAMLLLETLTAFSQEPPSPSLPNNGPGKLGDLLLNTAPELSSRERQRFQQFFFALPLEAKDPWPAARQGDAGTGRGGIAH